MKREEEIIDQIYRILTTGKQRFDSLMKESDRMVVETIIHIEREKIASPDPDIYKRAS